ncbi:MAG TPA: extracellular solute-binding protein [Microthrixaceae bacterium]|nr:extracellular solute-binding protein [Microthrixaceae bacterium]
MAANESMEMSLQTSPTIRPKRNRGRAFGAALLSLTLLAAACGGSETGAEKPKPDNGQDATEVNAANCPVAALDDAAGPLDITVWHGYNALTKQALEEAATAYNASQNKVKVHVEAQGSYEELLVKYESRLDDPSSLPDVIFSEDTTLQFMVDSGSVIAAGDCAAADPEAAKFYDDLLPSVRNTFSIRDVMWPSAVGISMPIMYLNNDHLKKAGLTTDDVPKTLADVRTVAEKLKAANIPGLESPIVMQVYGWYPENWLTGAGQTIVNEDNGHSGRATKSTIDNEYTHETLDWMQEMAKDGLLKAYPSGNGIDQFVALAQQHSSILIEGSRSITTVNSIVQDSYKGEPVEGAEGIDTSELKGLDVSVYPIPGLREAGQGAPAGSGGYIVNGENDAKVAASWDFMKFFNSDETQVQWTLMGSYLPATTTIQQNPKIKDYFENDLAGRWLSVVNTQLENTNPDFTNPIIGPYDKFRSGFERIIEKIVLDGAEVDSTLKTFDSDFQKALDQYTAEVEG